VISFVLRRTGGSIVSFCCLPLRRRGTVSPTLLSALRDLFSRWPFSGPFARSTLPSHLQVHGFPAPFFRIGGRPVNPLHTPRFYCKSEAPQFTRTQTFVPFFLFRHACFLPQTGRLLFPPRNRRFEMLPTPSLVSIFLCVSQP